MRAFVLALLASSVPAVLLAQPPSPSATKAAEAKEPFVRSAAEKAVRELATKLEENFVFPDKGKDYAAMLRSNLAAEKYASFADAVAFARAVTADLQAVHEDRHLSVRVVPPEIRARLRGEGPAPERRSTGMPANAVSKAGWLADGVAYIRFESFPGNNETKAAVRSFLDTHEDAKTLIIDARSHRGGGMDEMDLLLEQLYAEPVALVEMDTRVAVEQRRGSPIAGHPTLREVKGPAEVVRREHFVKPASNPTLASTKVYLLTSNKTASAAEHFSLSLKRTKRATLIGEATAGAGHYGGLEPLDEDFTFAALIPVGRTFDPDTGEGWEGTGVTPDVEVPSDKALDEALRLAGVNKSAEVALAELK